MNAKRLPIGFHTANFRRFGLLLTAASWFLVSPPSIQAGTPVYGQIVEINSGAKTIGIYESPSKTATYTVPGAAKIIIDGKPGEFSELHKDMKATVMHKPNSTEADMVNATWIVQIRNGHLVRRKDH